MKLKKRKKHSRMRGRRTHGFSAKLHKGSGNRGGKGMAGSGKRADQKKTFVLKNLFPYFGRRGFTSRKTEKKRNKEINLRDIENKYSAGEVNLENYKILGEGNIKKKFIIKAKSASKSAIEKIEKIGGKIIFPEKKQKKKETKEKEAKSKQEGKKEVKENFEKKII